MVECGAYLIYERQAVVNHRISFNQRKFRLRNFRYTNDISVKLSQVE